MFCYFRFTQSVISLQEKVHLRVANVLQVYRSPPFEAKSPQFNESPNLGDDLYFPKKFIFYF